MQYEDMGVDWRWFCDRVYCNDHLKNQKISGGSRGGSGGPLEPHSLPPCFTFPMKMTQFVLGESKLFHFHVIFVKNEIKSAKRPQNLYMNPFSRNSGPATAECD